MKKIESLQVNFVYTKKRLTEVTCYCSTSISRLMTITVFIRTKLFNYPIPYCVCSITITFCMDFEIASTWNFISNLYGKA